MIYRNQRIVNGGKLNRSFIESNKKADLKAPEIPPPLCRINSEDKNKVKRPKSSQNLTHTHKISVKPKVEDKGLLLTIPATKVTSYNTQPKKLPLKISRKRNTECIT